MSIPSEGGGHVAPTLSSAKLPVPYVFLAMPGSVQAWPNSAACWSPAMPLIGIPSGTPQRCDVTPTRPAEATTSGNAARGTPSSSHSSSSHARDRMSSSIVRLALLTSVTWTSPPVRFQMIHESIVPIARASVTGTPPCPSLAPRSQPIFVPLKYGSSTSPVRSRTSGRWPASARSRQRSAVRRSCHTIALP